MKQLLLLIFHLTCIILAAAVHSTPNELYSEFPTRTCPQKVLNVTREELEFVESYNVHMKRAERILLSRYLQKAKVYVEYGSGGSTELACYVENLAKIYTIESSQDWLDGLISSSECLKNSSRVVAVSVDIGKTKEWGNPVCEKLPNFILVNNSKLIPTSLIDENETIFTKDLNKPDCKEDPSKPWSAYPSAISSLPSDMIPDFILVDGRFRVACVLKILLTYGKSYPNVVIGFHDFFSRKYYHGILQFTEIVECTNDLAILKVKHDFDYEEVKKEFDRYVGIYD
jgi:hypothetical protein